MELQHILLIALTLNITMGLAMAGMGGATSDMIENSLRSDLANYFTIETGDNDTAQTQIQNIEGSTESPSGEDVVFSNKDVTGGMSLAEAIINLGTFFALFFTIIIGSIVTVPTDLLHLMDTTSGIPVIIRLFFFPIIMYWVYINFMLILKFVEIVRTGRSK